MKTKRIACALTEQDRKRVEHAAALMEVTISKFVLGAVKYALDEIDREIAESGKSP